MPRLVTNRYEYVKNPRRPDTDIFMRFEGISAELPHIAEHRDLLTLKVRERLERGVGGKRR